MDIQADINWIRAELMNVRDPHLIEAFKQLLTYRKTREFEPLTKTQFVNDIMEAEAQIDQGEYLSIEDFEKEAKQW
jgi:hypothetical protein